jgi:hypothetical protein
MNPQLSRCLQKGQSSLNVRLDGIDWSPNAAVDVRFGIKVDYPIASSYCRHESNGIANVSFDEAVVRMFRNRSQVRRVAGIGQLVENGEFAIPTDA